MSYEEVVTAARTQAAIMLIAYHRALIATLDELVAVLASQQVQRPSRAILWRFRTAVRALATGWSRP